MLPSLNLEKIKMRLSDSSCELQKNDGKWDFSLLFYKAEQCRSNLRVKNLSAVSTSLMTLLKQMGRHR